MLRQWRRLCIVPPLAEVLSRIAECEINLVNEILIPVPTLPQHTEHLRPDLVRHVEWCFAANPVENQVSYPMALTIYSGAYPLDTRMICSYILDYEQEQISFPRVFSPRFFQALPG